MDNINSDQPNLSRIKTMKKNTFGNFFLFFAINHTNYSNKTSKINKMTKRIAPIKHIEFETRKGVATYIDPYQNNLYLFK